MTIRYALDRDAEAISEIYNQYISASIATFEVEQINAEVGLGRIRACLDLGYPYLVAEDNDKIVGYAYAHQYRPRPAYGKTVEVSIYARPGFEGRGVASALYKQLLPEIFKAGFHTILAGIALPNDASVRLHEKFGFQKVAHLSEVGRKFDRWIDVGYWQLTAENAGHDRKKTENSGSSELSF